MFFSLLITVPLLLSMQAVTQIKAFSSLTRDQFLENSLEKEFAEDYDGGGGNVLCGHHRAATCAQCGNEVGSCNADCKWKANKCQSKNGQEIAAPSPHPLQSQQPKQPQKPPQSEPPHQSQQPQKQPGGEGGGGDIPCGSHRAPTCAQCGNDAGSCNGDCKWEANKCQSKNAQGGNIGGPNNGNKLAGSPKTHGTPQKPIIPQKGTFSRRDDSDGGGGDVLCGSHRAATCAQCGNEAGTCNADCKWNANKCQSKHEQGSPPPPSENPSPDSEPPATTQPAPEPTNSGGFSDYEQQSLIAHNKFRKMEGAGLSDLILDQSICQLVKAYANKLGKTQVMDHDYSQGMYENLHMAGAKLSPQEVAQSWYDEKTQPGCTDFACNGHYKIMVDPKIKKMCMAADNGGKKNWLVVARYS